MPNNYNDKSYVIGWANSNFLFSDFQFHLYENLENSYCSEHSYTIYSSLEEAQKILECLKSRAKKFKNFFFYSNDNSFEFDEAVDGKTDEDFYIIAPNFENIDDMSFGCKYLKLPLLTDDLKIFSRDVEVTYTKVTV